MAGVDLARAKGKRIGRPAKDGRVYNSVNPEDARRLRAEGLSLRAIAERLGASRPSVMRALRELV